MFRCHIELLSSVPLPDGGPSFLVVGTYSYDPNLQEGDEVWINNWKVWGKAYSLKSKVVGRKKEIYPPSMDLEEHYGEEAARNGILVLRVFVEAEDRDAVVEISEALRNNNPVGVC